MIRFSFFTIKKPHQLDAAFLLKHALYISILMHLRKSH